MKHAVGLLLLAVLGAGCGAVQMTLELSAPAEVVARPQPPPCPTPGPGGPSGPCPSFIPGAFAASWEATLAETGGEGGEVHAVRVDLKDAATGQPPPFSTAFGYEGPERVRRWAGASRIEPHGTLELPASAHVYLVPGQSIVATVAVHVVSDRGTTITLEAQTRISPSPMATP